MLLAFTFLPIPFPFSGKPIFLSIYASIIDIAWMFHRQLCINNHVKSSFLKNIGHTDAKTIRIEVVSVYLLRFLLY